jgi:hypothetical protein
MSKTDLIGSGCTLIAGAIAYLAGGPTAAILSFVVGVMLTVVAHLRIAEEEPPVTLGARCDIASHIPNNQSRKYESQKQTGAAELEGTSFPIQASIAWRQCRLVPDT